MEIIGKNISGNKSLGQFFSGKRVAALLAELAEFCNARTVIDPMCGTGDMLLPSQNCGNKDIEVTGVEIDPEVFEQACSRCAGYSNISVYNGDVFDSATFSRLHREGYDLVITNPPYVRYQAFAALSEYGDSFTDLAKLRSQLCLALAHFATMSDEERSVFQELIAAFSGLSDLAVPAWVFSAMLVKPGGRLAIVVPDTWLSRDYSLPVKYLLMRFFDIEYVVEDAQSRWFLPAQVKTNLVVAKRQQLRASLADGMDKEFLHASIFAKAGSPISLVGNCFPESGNAELLFKHAIIAKENVEGFFRVNRVRFSDLIDEIRQQGPATQWYTALEKNTPTNVGSAVIRSRSPLSNWFEGSVMKLHYLEHFNIKVGQGLRTGANIFFYLEIADENAGKVVVTNTQIPGIDSFTISSNLVQPAVRKQAELHGLYSLKEFVPANVVLTLGDNVLPEDANYAICCNPLFWQTYKTLPDPLCTYIRKAANYNVSKTSVPAFIPNLSAVKTNVRGWDKKRPEIPPRFWYMLPPFTKRHRPELFIPRVNNQSPRTYLNPSGKFVIDANFSSLMLGDTAPEWLQFAMLALLNSKVIRVIMEEYGTVMGGGALKLEATQLRRMPLPFPAEELLKRLIQPGRELALSPSDAELLLRKIDVMIIEAMEFIQPVQDKLNDLHAIHQKLLNKRRHNE